MSFVRRRQAFEVIHSFFGEKTQTQTETQNVGQQQITTTDENFFFQCSKHIHWKVKKIENRKKKRFTSNYL
jgi:hypothetical protein